MPNTYTNLLYHIVFSTKHRASLITDSLQDELYKYIGGIIREHGGTLLEIGGMPDHVHLVVRFKADKPISHLMQLIKGNSSKWVTEQKKQTVRFSWQEGYAAFSVSESQLPAVLKYVSNQEEHHRKTSFRDEFLALLRKHAIKYDERYILD
ncbi:MAG: transposase [Blastopirellula sp.]|nr:MAG: transposase [Blastopirellula sp.]